MAIEDSPQRANHEHWQKVIEPIIRRYRNASSERKRAADELQTHKEQFEHHLSEETKNLARINQKIRDLTSTLACCVWG